MPYLGKNKHYYFIALHKAVHLTDTSAFFLQFTHELVNGYWFGLCISKWLPCCPIPQIKHPWASTKKKFLTLHWFKSQVTHLPPELSALKIYHSSDHFTLQEFTRKQYSVLYTFNVCLYLLPTVHTRSKISGFHNQKCQKECSQTASCILGEEFYFYW